MASVWAAAAVLQMMSPELTILCKLGNGLLLLANLDVHHHVVPTESAGDRLR